MPIVVQRGGTKRIPDLFLSHNRRDKASVVPLALDLLYLGVDVWLDEWELKLGAKLHLAIERAVEDSPHFAPVISEHFMTSQWCIDELSAALAHEKSIGSTKVIPLLLDGSEPPAFLRDRLYLRLDSEYWTSLLRLAAHIRGYAPKQVAALIRESPPQTPTGAYASLRRLGWSGFVVLGHDEFQRWLADLNRLQLARRRL